MAEYADDTYRHLDPYEKTPWSVATQPASHAGGHHKVEHQTEWLTFTVTRSLNFGIDGLGEPITSGIKGDARIDLPCRLVGWALLADSPGDVVIDVWKAAFADFPPTDADSVTAGNEPSLVGAASAADTALDGWDIDLAAGDVLRFNVDSSSSITLLTVVLTLQPT